MAELAQLPGSRAWGPSQVHEQLCKDFPGDRDPISLRKVSGLWPKLRDGSELWSLSPDDPDPEFVLDCLAALVLAHPGARLTRREVQWIRAVHAGRPDMSPGLVLEAASLYRVCEAREDAEAAARLDAALARREPFELATLVPADMRHRLMKLASMVEDLGDQLPGETLDDFLKRVKGPQA